MRTRTRLRSRRCQLPQSRYLCRLSEQAPSNALVHKIFTNCSLSLALSPVPMRATLLFSPHRAFLSSPTSSLSSSFSHSFSASWLSLRSRRHLQYTIAVSLCLCLCACVCVPLVSVTSFRSFSPLNFCCAPPARATAPNRPRVERKNWWNVATNLKFHSSIECKIILSLLFLYFYVAKYNIFRSFNIVLLILI